MLSWIDDELEQLDAQSLRRRVRTPPGGAVLNFSTNDYLGLSRRPRVIEAATDAASHEGTGATSSRLISGHMPVHAALEARLARATGREAALVFPTGYMTNLGVIPSLVGAGDAVLLDRLCHASLVDAARLSGARLLVYRHADPADAERVLKRSKGYRRRLLVTESLFSMDGDYAPLAQLYALTRTHETMMLVDDAHAFGVRSDTVPGDVVVGTLSKALASQGGFAAGTKPLIEWLINKARSFIFTTGLSPMSAAAALAALDVAESEPERRARVSHLSEALRADLTANGWDLCGSQSHIVPVKVGSAQAALALAAHLEQEGVWAPAIRPPTVHAGECRLRFSVTAAHTEADIGKLLTCMANAKAVLA